MYNSKLRNKQVRRSIPLPFEDTEFDNEWITEEGEMLLRLSKLKLKMMV